MNGGWGISYEIALRWMPLDLTDDKSTLVQVMAWCQTAPSHYLSQCWPRSRHQMASLGHNELMKMVDEFWWHVTIYIDNTLHSHHSCWCPGSWYHLMLIGWHQEPGHQQPKYLPFIAVQLLISQKCQLCCQHDKHGIKELIHITEKHIFTKMYNNNNSVCGLD